MNMNLILKFIKANAYLIFIVVFSAFMFALTLRGHPGNPTPLQVEYSLNSVGEPFETSQERSRWAMVLSMYHDKSFAIDNYASMGTPDVGFIKGHYYSLFPPGLSILVLPFYAIGLAVGYSQLFVFSAPAMFSIGIMVLIYLYLRKLDVSQNISTLSALCFGFATSAWGYSVTLFAHLPSAFFMLYGLYLVVFNDKSKVSNMILAWLIYGLLIFIDFPNAILFAPIAVYMLFKSFKIMRSKYLYKLEIDSMYIMSSIVFALVLGFYALFNFVHFGSPTYLSNTIPRVRDLKIVEESAPESNRNAGQSLHTRNLINGLYTFSISPDRGVLIYSPVILLFVFGLNGFTKKNKHHKSLLVVIPTLCLILYSMFGDPYGGWAFGSRYLVAVMPYLLILSGLGLEKYKNNHLLKLLYNITILYSIKMVLMAALTTNVVPPRVEAEGLNLDYTSVINTNMINDGRLSSFFYNHVLESALPASFYFYIIFTLVGLVVTYLIWIPNNYDSKQTC